MKYKMHGLFNYSEVNNGVGPLHAQPLHSSMSSTAGSNPRAFMKVDSLAFFLYSLPSKCTSIDPWTIQCSFVSFCILCERNHMLRDPLCFLSFNSVLVKFIHIRSCTVLHNMNIPRAICYPGGAFELLQTGCCEHSRTRNVPHVTPISLTGEALPSNGFFRFIRQFQTTLWSHHTNLHYIL